MINIFLRKEKCILYFSLIYVIIVLTYNIHLSDKLKQILDKVNFSIDMSTINDLIIENIEDKTLQVENGNINIITIINAIIFSFIGLKCPNHNLIVFIFSVSFELILLYLFKSSNLLINPTVAISSYIISSKFSKKNKLSMNKLI